jgi:hypothetical protein
MSIFKKTVAVQGEVLVERDPTGTVTRKSPPPEKGMTPILNWRRQVRHMTNNGIDGFKVLINLMNGVPQKVTLPDGTESEWIIPTMEVQRQSAKDIIEFINGKAVAQTEVMKAEKEAEDVEQYQAMSDDALREAARPFLERAQKKLSEGEE